MINEHPRVPAIWMFENYRVPGCPLITRPCERPLASKTPLGGTLYQRTGWVVESSNFCYEKEPKPALSNRLYIFYKDS